MKKALLVFEIIILLLLVGAITYTANNFSDVSKQESELASEVAKLEENLSKREEEINNINSEINNSKLKNEDKTKEYEKWQRHKEKLAKLLGY